ncbi:YybH family protein [Stakelama pacifica]|uniref:Uncharacterized protein (TIGR02246 family) n=1 Tax=Stakelama pacifica TaxID=517720 RepID=A0A4R6FPV2_9SPHN|nr:nuclear transport factor 2 family protein [Stakelama pacifica]MAW99849.1 hypothetical protein [Sphingomonas sp.]TDN83711.1 uncharacterized protein (TIGR02246 family) [Stakelama pacifica]GGO94600.1 hypothetical protein GCM10011329_16860 [Stakelama pacifica]
MTMWRMVLAGAALLIATPAIAQEDAARSPLAGMLAARETALAQALNSGHVADAVDFYEDDALLLAPGEPPMQGEKAIANVLAGFAAGMRNLSVTPALIRPLGDDYALVLGIQSFEQPGENGTSDVIRMKYQSIWHRGDDGVWRLASDMMNAMPDQPAP